MRSVVTEIATASQQCNSVFVMYHPTGDNTIDGMVTDFFPREGAAVGIPVE
jgi:hypothetical protein